MQFTVVPASAQTCRAAVQALLDHESKPVVVGLYRDLKKVPVSFQQYRNFKAVYGDVSDARTLDFAGSDAVLTMTPPKYDGSDMFAWVKTVATNVRDAAIKAHSVKRLVYISSIGAQYSAGMGEVRTNHESERIFKSSTADLEIVLIRNGYFMENWASALGTIKANPPYFCSTVTPIDYRLPMVSARDIGRTCAGQLVSTSRSLKVNPYIFELHGPQFYSTRDVQQALESVTGKSIEARLVEKDQLHEYFNSILPSNITGLFVEMTLGLLPGGILDKEMKKADGAELEGVKRGRDTLVEAFQAMISASPGT